MLVLQGIGYDQLVEFQIVGIKIYWAQFSYKDCQKESHFPTRTNKAINPTMPLKPHFRTRTKNAVKWNETNQIENCFSPMVSISIKGHLGGLPQHNF